MRFFVRALSIAALIAVLAPVSIGGQGSPADEPPLVTRQGGRSGGRGGAAGDAAQTITPQQIQMLFDGMVLSRAQGALQLNDQQFAVFIPKLLTFQKGQQRHRQQRQARLAELRRLVASSPADGTDDASMSEKTKAIDDLEVQAAQEQQRTLADLDAVLTPRQRARFRVFLENMEREKIVLLVRAQQGRAAQPPPAAK